MLECADGSYYVGSTWHLEQRVDDHNSGKGTNYTSRRLPVRLVWAEHFDSMLEAYALERKLHGWGRAKRQALVAGRLDLLGVLGSRARQRSALKRKALDALTDQFQQPPPSVL